MTDARFAQIDQDVKLVIWDLDETFWHGTLSEGGITPVKAHVDMLRELVDRGIMCSICSKNDFETAKAKLVELGIWELFVFPHIDWSPKGAAVRSIIERMGLRPQNTVFLDDNHLNLEEVKFFCPEIACVDASGTTDGTGDDLGAMLALKPLAGKNDRKHSRLQQYKVMETKETEQQQGGLSNEEFLRQSEIKVRVVTDIDDKMDRVLELLNRTNQLNFTKVRANTEKERAALDELLRIPGVHAGLIEVRDRYGDYGFVGFFCIRKRFDGTSVQHFAFSCRTLSMGVEQWVWDYLGRPEFQIVGPVASELATPAQVDWISHVADFGGSAAASPDRHLGLVGGCDLQQVSFYCGSRRDEFVNKPDENGVIVRYDDAGFLLNPRDPSLERNWVLTNIAGHRLTEMEAADESFKRSDVIILSLFFAFLTDNLFTYEGHGEVDRYLVTLPPKRLSALTSNPKMAIRMLKTLRHLRLTETQRLDLVRKCFQRVHAMKRPDALMFVLGAGTRFGAQAERTAESRKAYNAMCHEFCNAHAGSVFIDVDRLVPEAEFFDSDHYTRNGYFRLAEFINSYALPLAEAV